MAGSFRWVSFEAPWAMRTGCAGCWKPIGINRRRPKAFEATGRLLNSMIAAQALAWALPVSRREGA